MSCNKRELPTLHPRQRGIVLVTSLLLLVVVTLLAIYELIGLARRMPFEAVSRWRSSADEAHVG